MDSPVARVSEPDDALFMRAKSSGIFTVNLLVMIGARPVHCISCAAAVFFPLAEAVA